MFFSIKNVGGGGGLRSPLPPLMVETVFNLKLERWAIFTMVSFFYSFQRSLCICWPFRNIYLNPLEVSATTVQKGLFRLPTNSHFQNAAKCKTFLGKMSYLHENKRIIFLSMASQFATRKCPIYLHKKTNGRNSGRCIKTVVIGKLKEDLCWSAC